MAERYGSLFRRVLLCADAFSDLAILAGSSHVNTSLSRSKALLCLVTSADHRLFVFFVEAIRHDSDETGQP